MYNMCERLFKAVYNDKQRRKAMAKNRYKLREFNPDDLIPLLKLIWDTIDVCYRPVYSDEAITHWEDEHNETEILKDASEGIILIVELEDKIIGTGTLLAERIKRVYVDPALQGRGLGKMIMAELEKRAGDNGLKEIRLYASVPAKKFYDAIGYNTYSESFLEVKGKRLNYYNMDKEL
ncbi:MAG: GNAT family N-acetyltransferase [Sedimentisphaerales bacterium]|nr:GNAT family N-acetyltransferase [Sedimentisphaerales bacterium]